MKAKKQREKQKRKQDRRKRSSWMVLGAVGAVVAHTAGVGNGVTPAYAGWSMAFQAPVQPAAQVYQFNIPAGPLDDVIDAFEATARIEIMLSRTGLAEVQSPGVRGSFTVDQALRQALQGIGITFEYRTPTTVVLSLQAAAQFVDVTGVAPEMASPKFTGELVNTPQSVTVIPSQVFSQQGARNLTEVLRNTPGITFNAGENGFASGTSNFSLRGFDTSGSVFVDSSRDSGNYFRDVFNVEQVEVVKGPAGDNGRGGAGGYINLATKSPTAEGFYRGSVSYGFDQYDSRDRRRVAIDFNRPLNENTAVRLNTFWQDGGVPGRAFAEKDSWGFAPSVSLGMNGPTRFVASYQRIEQTDVPDWGVPGALIEGMITYNADAGSEANRSRFYGHSNDYDDVTSDSVLARFEHEFSSRLRVSNQTRWSKTEREALYAIPTGYTAATRVATTQRQGYRRENAALSNLTNLAASFDTGSLLHSFSTGFEVSREDSDASRYPTNGVLGNPGSTPIDDPNPNRNLAGFVGLNPLQTAEVGIDTLAAYAYNTTQIHPKWQITGGLRVERYGVDLQSKTAAGAPQGPDGYQRDDTTASGKAGLVFKPAEEGSVYASVGFAALPPASFLSNPDISRDGDNAFPGWTAGQNSATSKVQRSTNYEVGTKWNLFRERLSATTALFRTVRSNIAMAGTVNGVANTFAGYARQVVRGVEVGASGRVTAAWSFFGGLLFMDSERRHDAAVDAARRAANPADYGTKTSTNGDELAFTPRVSGNFWTTYRLPVGLTFGGGAQHVGSSFLGRPDDAERIIANGNAGKLPSFTVLDIMAAYEVNSRLTLRFNIDNVTDRFYAVSSNWPGSRVSLGPSRSFAISADMDF